MSITKLDVAEREIVAAVRLLFDGGDCVPVYVLAAAAREITTTLCEKRRIRSMFDGLDDAFPEKTRTQMYNWVHAHAGFFKHARTDPNGVLEGFEEDEAKPSYTLPARTSVGCAVAGLLSYRHSAFGMRRCAV
jgi:hypothetical protein